MQRIDVEAYIERRSPGGKGRFPGAGKPSFLQAPKGEPVMSLVIFFIRFNGAVFLGYGLFAHLLPRNRFVGVRSPTPWRTARFGGPFKARPAGRCWPWACPASCCPGSSPLLRDFCCSPPFSSGSWSCWSPSATVMRGVSTRPSTGRPRSCRRDGSATSPRATRKTGPHAGLGDMIFSWLKNQRRNRLLAEPIPWAWLEYLRSNVRHYQRLDGQTRSLLCQVTQVLVAEKNWVAGRDSTSPRR